MVSEILIRPLGEHRELLILVQQDNTQPSHEAEENKESWHPARSTS